MHKHHLAIAMLASIAIFSFNIAFASEQTHMRDSVYNQDIRKATTSKNLTNADLAWHAVNTYGWDCEEVISRSKGNGDYFILQCSNGKKLRVYPREGKHPKITNIKGGYK